jgi:hypothetical protein
MAHILAAFESVGGLSRNHTPHATTWVLHIALTARDQMDMGMANCLSGCVPIVYANVESAHRRVFLHYLSPQPDQQLIDRASLRLEQVEESRCVPFGDDERMQFGHWMIVPDRKSQCVMQRRAWLEVHRRCSLIAAR